MKSGNGLLARLCLASIREAEPPGQCVPRQSLGTRRKREEMTTPPMPLAPSFSWLRSLAAFASYPLLIAPFWRRSWFHRIGRLCVIAVYAYLCVLLALLALEDRLLFHPTTADVWLPPPRGANIEDVNLTSADGTPIHAWWGAPDGWTPEQGAVLFCHGNAGNVSEWGQEIPIWQAYVHTGVIVFDYPGYGKSGGIPSEAGCYAAADAAYDWLVHERQVPSARILLIGRSLGCAMAIDLACRRSCRALILCSPFTYFPDLAQEKYPFFPCRWLAHNQFNNLHKIAGVRGPVFIAHGTADTLVPVSQGQCLYAAAPEPKRFLAMPGLDHNDGPSDAFYQAVGDFLAERAAR
jgi:uncharacterized protein